MVIKCELSVNISTECLLTYRSTARRTQLFSNSGVGSFKSHKNRYVKVLWDSWDLCGFSSLTKKTRKSIHLQTSLHKRQQFLLSYLKALSVGQAKVWIRNLPSADQCSPKWANQCKWLLNVNYRSTYQPNVCRHIDPYVSWVLVTCWLSFGRVSVAYWLRYGPNVAMANL